MVLKSFHGTIIMGPGWYDYHTFTIIVQPYYYDSIIFTITHPYYSVSSHLLIALWRAGYSRLTHTPTLQTKGNLNQPYSSAGIPATEMYTLFKNVVQQILYLQHYYLPSSILHPIGSMLIAQSLIYCQNDSNPPCMQLVIIDSKFEGFDTS